jgi:glycosyltransferase involved in cell wall biosynthesis
MTFPRFCPDKMNMKVATIIPCYNEELTIEKVLADVKRYLPEACIYVFDNNSTDSTSRIAKQCGAIVMKEKRQGKGFVVQSMFNEVDADIYIMVDGDDTYDLSRINEMVSMILDDEADMVVGNRLKDFTDKSFRPLHCFGNKLVRKIINNIFRADLKDIMSGLRVMNREFVKNINIMSAGFEVETEMTLKALKYNYVIKEVEVKYKGRPEGSHSKLNTFTDGFLVIKNIFLIFKDYRPLIFFSAASFILLLASFAAGSVVIQEFIETRYIKHVPLAIFASGSMILSIIFFVTGLIIDSTNRRFDELINFIRNKE